MTPAPPNEDIVALLRKLGSGDASGMDWFDAVSLAKDAASEIEQLRERVEHLESALWNSPYPEHNRE